MDRQISDHLLALTVLRSTLPKSHSRKIYFRSLKTLNQEKFMQDLQMALFSIIDIFWNVDDKLYVFEQVYGDIMDGQAFILWMSTPLLNRLLLGATKSHTWQNNGARQYVIIINYGRNLLQIAKSQIMAFAKLNAILMHVFAKEDDKRLFWKSQQNL